jgi:hypothetical protein
VKCDNRVIVCLSSNFCSLRCFTFCSPLHGVTCRLSTRFWDLSHLLHLFQGKPTKTLTIMVNIPCIMNSYQLLVSVSYTLKNHLFFFLCFSNAFLLMPFGFCMCYISMQVMSFAKVPMCGHLLFQFSSIQTIIQILGSLIHPDLRYV